MLKFELKRGVVVGRTSPAITTANKACQEQLHYYIYNTIFFSNANVLRIVTYINTGKIQPRVRTKLTFNKEPLASFFLSV